MKLFHIIFAVLFLAFIAMAGDTFNQDVTITESYDQVTVTFAPDRSADSTGSFHSKPIFIGNMNDADAIVHCITNAASDINLLLHLSSNRTNWTAVTPGSIDAVSTTAELDTLGGSDTGNYLFHFYNWLVIEDDGQAGCNDDDVMTTTIVFQKDSWVYDASGANVHVAYIVNRSVTNP